MYDNSPLIFQAPQLPLPWQGVKQATQHGPICPQTILGTGQYIPGNEDCLFLNVYTPTISPEALLPVMFYIHGRDLVIGSGNDDYYGPDFLLDQDVVVVTINYRLGALGFLCLDIKEVPGNAGLKDQVAALRWVKRNIEQFGGNPNNITLFGQSSGGSSVSLHALSPLSKGLFQRAIIMSGVALNIFSKSFEPKRHSLMVAQKAGLYTKDSYTALKFLQNAPVEAVVTAIPNIFASEMLIEASSQTILFPPVVEKNFGGEHFMLCDPEKLLLEGETNDVDIIIGHTEEEAITRVMADKDYIFQVYPYFKELLVPLKITNYLNPENVLQVGDIIQNHYFGDREISERYIKDFVKFYTYYVYVYDIHRYLEMWTKNGKKAYFYIFECFSERNVFGRAGIPYGLRKATHDDDLMYLFNAKKFNLNVNKGTPSYKMIVQTTTLFANFAKFGNPTPPPNSLQLPTPTWLDYGKKQTVMKINLQLTQKPVDITEINFWRKLFNYVGLIFS